MKSLVERFESKLIRIPIAGCWLWLDTLDGDGYGELKYNYVKRKAHRVSWILHKGIIPETLCVLHRCDVPSCVNPAHLFIGTRNDNNQDMKQKGRQALGVLNGTHTKPECRPRGIAHGKAKVTEEIVYAIRADTRSQRKIAAAYNITQNTVYSIKRRRTWTHL